MSLIFEETKTLTPNDTKTNVPLQFYVAEELEKMKIELVNPNKSEEKTLETEVKEEIKVTSAVEDKPKISSLSKLVKKK